MKRRKTLLLILLSIVVLLFFSGCKEKSLLTPKSLSFEGDVSRIKIEYHRVDFGGLAEESFYEINQEGDKFVTKEGKIINSEKIYRLSNSLINLHKSGGLKSCMSHTDDYPSYKVEILYSNGERVVLSSDSNCYKNIPWNVITKDRLFVQYSNEIPDALFLILEKELLGSMSFMPPISLTGGNIPPEFEYNYEGFFEFSNIHWSAATIKVVGYPEFGTKMFHLFLEKDINMKIKKIMIENDGIVHECQEVSGGIECYLEKIKFPLEGDPFKANLYIEYEDKNKIVHKTEGSVEGKWILDSTSGISYIPKQIDFSEKEFYSNILTESRLFKPFLSKYKISELALFCQLNENNTDCSEVDGIITLKLIDGETIESVPVKFKNQKVIEIGYDFKEMEDIKKKIYEHALVKKIKNFIPDTNVIIKGPGSIRFDNWVVNHGFIYYPKTNEMQVDNLWYTTRFFQENRNILNLNKVLELYRVPGYETFVDDNIIDFEVQSCRRKSLIDTCRRLIVSYKEGVLEQNPDYVQKLKEKYPYFYHFENAISIYNYFVFVNDKGELEVKEPTEIYLE